MGNELQKKALRYDVSTVHQNGEDVCGQCLRPSKVEPRLDARRSLRKDSPASPEMRHHGSDTNAQPKHACRKIVSGA